MIDLFEYNKHPSILPFLCFRGKAAVFYPVSTGKSFIGLKLCWGNPNKVSC